MLEVGKFLKKGLKPKTKRIFTKIPVNSVAIERHENFNSSRPTIMRETNEKELYTIFQDFKIHKFSFQIVCSNFNRARVSDIGPDLLYSNVPTYQSKGNFQKLGL